MLQADLRFAARVDTDFRVHRAGRERYEHVIGVGGSDYYDCVRARYARFHQHAILQRRPHHKERAGGEKIGLERCVALDHYPLAPAALHLLGHHSAHPAEAANHDMTLELFDSAPHRNPPDDLSKLTFDHELGDGGEDI